MLPWYIICCVYCKPAIIGGNAADGMFAMTAKKASPQPPPREVERIQTGVRLEKRLLKVLKALAEYLDLSLGDLLEGIALHALENKPPFKRLTLEKIAQLRRVYGFDLVAADSHRLREQDGAG
jgi:predicted DNA-binding ribbon-helix-helix protein